jgi:HD-GYP domain-containing protein (c-di-GMP phosphodiesterase class II)
MSIQYDCPNCKKTYKLYKNYSKHTTICSEKYKDKHKQLTSINIEQPSSIQQTLEYLLKSVAEIKESIKIIQRENTLKYQKISIFEWLTRTHANTICFREFVNNLNLNNKQFFQKQDINFLFDELHSLLNNSQIPLKAFNIKPNIIYVYIDNNWKVFDTAESNLLIIKISKLLLCNLSELNNSEDYAKLVPLINSININNKSFITKLYKFLYQELKSDIQIIELV